MLTELCQELHNWFDRDQPKWHGDFEISNGELILRDDMSLKNGQYFRIIGSVLNDGVYCYPASGLTDETFSGSVWSLAVPPAVITLATEIGEWVGKYSAVVNSPYTSESWGGYSYTKASAGDGSSGTTWQSVFANRLNRWRKI